MYKIMFEFLTDYTKTSITSILSISTGWIIKLDVLPILDVNNYLSTISLLLGCFVGIFAVINGHGKMIENFRKNREYKRKQKELKETNKSEE